MVIDPPDSGESRLGLRHYLEVVRRRKWIVLAVFVTAVGTAALLSLLTAPVYRATTKIVVGQGNSLIPPGDAYAIQPYAATMGDLVTSDVVARNVIDNLDLRGETPGSLLERTSASINPDTAVVTVSVEDGDKQRAVRIAQEIGTVFSELVEEQFGTTEQTQPDEVAQLPLTAKVFDPAHPDPNEPISPKPVQNVVIASLLGLVLALLAAFLREHFDRKLRTREAVEQSFGVPVIGEIPFKKGYDGAAVMVARNAPEVAEAYRGLRASLQYLTLTRPLRTILITSASAEQGKTNVTANFAAAIARAGGTTVAVEGDLRRPRLAEALGAPKQLPGLTSLLVGDADLESVIADVPLFTRQNGSAPGSDDRVSLLPSGPLPPNPSELLSSPKMQQVLEDLTDLYDYVLVDSPPLLPVADALELARIVDGVIVVARRNCVTSDEARRVRTFVERLDINLLGVVFTDVEPVDAYYGSYEADHQPEARPLAAAGTGRAQEDL